MSSQNPEELQRKVEEVKQDADVQRALQQATATEQPEVPVTRARGRDKVWIATQLFLLIALGALYQFIKYRLPQFAYPLFLKLILAIGVVVVCFTAQRLVDVYFMGRVRNAVYQYNLKRVSRLLLWLVIAFFVLTIFFQKLVHGGCFVRFDFACTRLRATDADHEFHWLGLHSRARAVSCWRSN